MGWSHGDLMRFGRWKSDAFHGYLWDKVDGDNKAAIGMANQEFDTHAGALIRSTTVEVNRHTSFQEMYRGLPSTQV